MSNYTKTVNFASKDSLASGDANKIVKGTEIDTEFNNISTAIATKGDSGAAISANLITSGSLADARLSSNVALLTGTQTLTGAKTFTGTVGIGAANPSSGNWPLYCENNGVHPGSVFFNDTTSSWAQIVMVATTKTQLVLFQKSNDTTATGTTTDVGSIQTSGSSTTYSTSSDYRLKTNVTPMTGAIARVKNLIPVRFNWLSDLTAPAVDGFIAHEVSAVVPEAITGVKDEVYPDGRIMPQGIDQAKLVPLLVAALQEAIARIEALEAA